jgi:hypothetical protein
MSARALSVRLTRFGGIIITFWINIFVFPSLSLSLSPFFFFRAKKRGLAPGQVPVLCRK